MANFFSLQDGNLTDPSIYGYSLTTSEVMNNTTGTNILTSSVYSPYFVSDGSSISAIAVHLSSRSANPSGTFSVNANVISNLNETSFVDTTNNSIVINNNSVYTTTDTPFAPNMCGSFADAGNTYIAIPSNSATALKANDFTIEFWLLDYDPTSTTTRAYYSNYTTWGSNAISIEKNSSKKFAVYYGSYSTTVAMFVDPNVMTSGWNHWAVTRNGNTYTLYKNGSSLSAYTHGTSISASGATNVGYIGALGNNLGNYVANGAISNFRIVNGTCLYTSNFTPSTTPLTNVPNTALLTLQNGSAKDNSSNNLFLTASKVKFLDFSPFSASSTYSPDVHGGSAYIPLSSSLQIPSSLYTRLSTNPFTLEFWFKTKSTLDNTLLFSNQNSTSNGLQIIANTDNYGIIQNLGGNLNVNGDASNTVEPFAGEGSYYLDNTNNTGANYKYILFSTGIQNLATPLNWTLQYWVYQTRMATGPSSRFHFSNGPSTGYGIKVFNQSNTTTQLWWTLPNSTNTGYLLNENTTATIAISTWTHIAVVRNGSEIYFYKDGTKYRTKTGLSTNPLGVNDYLSFGTPNNNTYSSSDGSIYLSNISLQYRSIDFAGTRPTAPLIPYDPNNALLLRSPLNKNASYYTSRGNGNIKVYNGNTLVNTANTNAYNDNSWHHLALTRDSNGSKLFLDGIQQGANNSTQSSSNFDDPSPTIWSIGKPLVGANGSDVYNYNYYNGYISNFRAISGASLYTTSFIPSSVPLTKTSNTTVLLNTNLIIQTYNSNVGTYTVSGFTSYNGSNNLLTNHPQNWQILKFNNALTSLSTNSILIDVKTSDVNQLSLVGMPLTAKDISKSNIQPYFVGSPYLTSFKPYTNFDDSIYVNGNSNYVVVPANSAFDFGSKDFTIECWFNVVSSSTDGAIVSIWGGTNSFLLMVNSNTLRFHGNGALFITGPTISYNTWYHVAIVRTNALISMYVNGTLVSTPYNISTNEIGSSTYNLLIGKGEYNNSWMIGYVNNLRITNGSSVYKTNFVPSTTPLMIVPSTVLLLKSGANYDKALIVNNNRTGIMNIGVTTLSSDSPFGAGIDGSIKFSGGASNDFISIPANEFFNFSGDFTIEFWLNTSIFTQDTPNSRRLLSFGPAGTSNLEIILGTSTVNNNLISLYNGAALLNGTIVVADGIWHHVLVSRNSGSLRLFVDGVQSGSTITNTTIFNSGVTNLLTIGSYNNLNVGRFVGLMSNCRIINGVGLYTSNFTKPTAPLDPTLGFGTVLFINASTYNLSSYKYNAPVSDIHIGGSLKGLDIESRIITADSYSVKNLYVHNQGTLTFPLTSSKTLTLFGSAGLQITSNGNLNVGTSSNAIPLSSTHTIILSNTQIDVHNGGNLNVYGYPKLVTTYLSSDVASGNKTFVTTNSISSSWLSGDSVLFVPNTSNKISFDNLILSSFNDANTFTTTVSNTYLHHSLSSLPNIPSVANLSRNIIIKGLNSTNRGIIRTLDAAKTYVNYVQLSNVGTTVLGNNSSGYTVLSGNYINTDNTTNVTFISGITGKPLQNVVISNNILLKSNNGLTLSSLSCSDTFVLNNNLILSSGGVAGIQLISVSANNLNWNNNTVIGSLSYGTLLLNDVISGNIGTINYNSPAQGLLLSAISSSNIQNVNSLYSGREGVYVDASTSNLSSIIFNNISAINNSSVGFKVSGNSLSSYLTPTKLNINNLVSNNNNNFGFEGYNIIGSLTSLTLNNNVSGGIRTSIGNGPTTFDGLTSILNGTNIDILTGYNYSSLLIKNALLSSLSSNCLILDSTKFSKFSLENSILSATTPIQLKTSRNLLEGSYLFNNTYLGSIYAMDIFNKYQPYCIKSNGFSFMNHNKISENHFAYLPAGVRTRDTVVFDPDANDNVSERLTPISFDKKLRSSSKFVAIDSGDTTSIRVNVLTVSSYNGSAPRLMLRRNAAAGIYSDMVLGTLDTTLGYDAFFEIFGQAPVVIDNCVLEFYVDCDGTAGYICVDSWFAN